MRGINQEDFSKFLKESFVSVWVDYESGFGTFPLESMISGTPVIGKVPALQPEWLEESNGLWTYQFNEIVDLIANFTQNWLEDNINKDLYENMYNTAIKYQEDIKFQSEVIDNFTKYFDTRSENFKEQLEKLKITEEKI
jgi:glycosyltransferase involved in cell wall biosynthesis